MKRWPDTRIIDLFKIDVPIIQAPMAGVDTADLAIAVAKAGGLGSLACALRRPDEVRQAVGLFRKETDKPINLNFFCHQQPVIDAERKKRWKEELQQYYDELGIGQEQIDETSTRRAFDSESCDLVDEVRPDVVSFHFGLPAVSLMQRVKAAGVKVISTATSVREALWLEAQGCDAIIAQGFEAGGHRGFFMNTNVHTQTGTMALVPQIADAVKIPVIAAGGIGDGRGVAAAFMLGASAVQLGTAYLFCPEVSVSKLYRAALSKVRDDNTVITNIFSGGAARGIVNRFIEEVGPLSSAAPSFPLAGPAVAPLRKKSEELGRFDFMQMWSGQTAALNKTTDAAKLTSSMAEDALNRIYNVV